MYFTWFFGFFFTSFWHVVLEIDFCVTGIPNVYPNSASSQWEKSFYTIYRKFWRTFIFWPRSRIVNKILFDWFQNKNLQKKGLMGRFFTSRNCLRKKYLSQFNCKFKLIHLLIFNIIGWWNLITNDYDSIQIQNIMGQKI